MSSSTTPNEPMPAAARYISAGAPRPPAPITSTEASFSAAWPGPPTSRSTIWRGDRPRLAGLHKNGGGSFQDRLFFGVELGFPTEVDRESTPLYSPHPFISYVAFSL